MTKTMIKLFEKMKTLTKIIYNIIKERLWRKELCERIINDKNDLIRYNDEYAKYIDVMQNRGIVSVFNALFEKNYKSNDIIVERDNEIGLKYVLYKENKLYYPRKSRTKWIKQYHSSILLEQDEKSPHRYFDNGENLEDYIFFDLGAAEGNFSLEIVEKAKHVYLFEADKNWNEALKKTFEPWKEKLTIVNKFVSNINTGDLISLNSYIRYLLENNSITENDKIFIKLDIEGNEETVLADTKSILNKFENVKLAVCLYHHKNAETNILKILSDEYMIDFRDGYMLFYYDNLIEFPYFRHGIIRAEKLHHKGDRNDKDKRNDKTYIK